MLERDSLAFELKTKRLALDRQKLLVEDVTRQVDELKVRSPVDGQVGQLIVQQRANVAANAPLMTVIDLSALEIEVQIPEVFAHDLSIGMPAEVQDGSGKYTGEVSAVSPEVVNGQVTGRVRFGDNKPAGLRQNQQLTTRILIDEHPNVLMVDRGPFVDTRRRPRRLCRARRCRRAHDDPGRRDEPQCGRDRVGAEGRRSDRDFRNGRIQECAACCAQLNSEVSGERSAERPLCACSACNA